MKATEGPKEELQRGKDANKKWNSGWQHLLCRQDLMAKEEAAEVGWGTQFLDFD